MANFKTWLLLVSLVYAYDILQITDEATSLSLSSSVMVDLPASPCSSTWGESTISGWFRLHSPDSSPLLSMTTATSSLSLHKEPTGQVEAIIKKREKQIMVLSVGGAGTDWFYVSLAQSNDKKSVTLCAAPWKGKMECMTDEMPKWIGAMELAKAKVRLGNAKGSGGMELLDVLVAAVALSPSESERLSKNGECLDDSCLAPAIHRMSSPQKPASLTSTCAINGLQAKEKYSDSELYHFYSWEWGLNLFLWDTYYFYPNLSTVKAIFVLDDDIGDPDMEVWHCGYISCDYLVEKADAVGPDSITVDWKDVGYEEGMNVGQALEVYISGKSWFTWYTVTFNYYSTGIFRVSNGRELRAMTGAPGTIVRRPWGTMASLAMLIGLATATGIFVRKMRSKKEMTNPGLLDRLLIKRED